MKLFKLRVVLDLGEAHSFATWYTIADDAVSAIDKIKTLLMIAFPKAEIFVEVKGE